MTRRRNGQSSFCGCLSGKQSAGSTQYSVCITQRGDTVTNEVIRYSILDPAGNITALVESPVPVDKQPETAADLMRRHPEVEQVGFVRFDGLTDGSVNVELRMAGGEFCGNASICAAALYLLEKVPEQDGSPVKVRLCVSGTLQPVDAVLQREKENSFSACICLPPAESIAEKELSFGTVSDALPVVCLEGISHIIIGSDSPFFRLQEDPAAAEEALRIWCSLLSADSLGLIFLEPDGPDFRMTPFVYVPGSGTFFRENSCASGSAAAAMYLAAERSVPVSLTLLEPGGTIRAECDPHSGKTFLSNRVRLIARFGDMKKQE